MSYISCWCVFLCSVGLADPESEMWHSAEEDIDVVSLDAGPSAGHMGRLIYILY